MPEANLTPKQMLEMYYFMKLGRSLEERLEILYRQGRIPSAIYLGRGQEATTVGASYALEEGDVIATTHRDMIAQLPRGMSPRMVMAQHFGKATSPTKGKGEANYLGDLSLGILTTVSMLPDFYPVIAGAALAFKMRREKRVALAYCGEGATSRGDFHEALNFASVHQLPAVFVVINNQYAYSTPKHKEMKVKDVAQRAAAYDIPGAVADGNDVLQVYKEAKKAVDRARTGQGPTLLEAKTLRMRGHAGHDPAKYVPRKLLEEWEKKDPLKRYEDNLIKEGQLTEEGKKETEKRVNEEVEAALKFAEESPYPKPEEVTEGVFR